MSKFYVYVYLRTDGTPYYVGKGTKDRAWQKHMRKNENQLAVPPRDRIVFVAQNLLEEETHEWEVALISILGRKDLGTGCLRNLTDGGEGMSGRTRPQKERDAISSKLKGRKKPPRSEAHCRALGQSIKQTQEMKGHRKHPSIKKRLFKHESGMYFAGTCTELSVLFGLNRAARSNLGKQAAGKRNPEYKTHGWVFVMELN